MLTDEQLAFLNAFGGRLIWGLNRELEPTDEWFEDEDWLFWVTHRGCICTGFGHHDPLPLKCTGFDNLHKCGVSGIALQGVLRCPQCYPKLQKKEPT